MKARAIRADAATTSADQSVPLAYTLERAEAIMEKSIPNAIEPLLPALRRRAFGKVDKMGMSPL